ncbi:restriction endonuclease subunit S [Aeribacillus composti]|uniref:restriction endonuclease subunit S n=1 Tax=Aeribacillus composti TaxID=1868734 RepID=UPI002E1B4085|nr:restriction endonuclease subunit S [Aeribacillus composti]
MSKKKQKSIEELLEEALVPEEEHPYKVPENWVWVRLGSVISSVKGKKPKELLETKESKSIPYVTIDYLTNGVTEETKYVPEQISKVRCNKEDILMVWDGARSGFVGRGVEGEVGSTLAKIEKRKFDTGYLYYFLKSKYEYINNNHRGTGIPHVNPEVLWNIPFPVSPLNEQKRIAEKIERLFAKIDEAKRLIEEVKESFELRKISIIKKIIDEGKEDAQQRGWKFAAIKNIFEIKGGGTPSKSNESYWNGTIPWISAKDMKTLYIQETKDYITEEGLNNSSAKMVTKGSIAMVVRSGILQHSLPVAYLMTDCTVNQDLKVFNSGDELVNKYFLWYVKANEKYLLNEYSKAGTTVNSIEFEKFKSHIMSIPPREEIEKKIIKLESIVNKENEIKMYVDQILQLENLKHAILHKAFRGELGTNDPTDEHAIGLLKEVLKSK